MGKPGVPPPTARKTPQRGKERSATGESPGLSSAHRCGTAPGKNPSWSTVVRDGCKRKAVPENYDHRSTVKSRAVKPQARYTRKKTGITGIAVANNEELSTVEMKMVCIFATKFNINLDADTFRLYEDR